MLPNFEIPIIETYTQLAGVLLVLAILAAACRQLWLKWRRRAQIESSLSPLGAPRPEIPAEPHRRPIHPQSEGQGAEFAKLAAYVASAGVRAEHISATQSAAALKLDTVEVAVNRLLADMDGIMVVPRGAPPATSAAAQSAPSPQTRSNIAA